MSGYKISRAAQSDLRAIWRFTVERWGRTQADIYLYEIIATLNIVAKTPGVGPDRSGIKPAYRCYPHGRHMLWYKCQSEHIVLMRVLHDMMDSKRHL
jgi:toxin ParE1/3/4